jgi:cytochrome P450
MSDTAVQPVDVASLPLPPRNPLAYRQRVRALRVFHTGQEALRNAGGPVTSLGLGPKRLVAPIVVTTSPAGIRDVLGRNDAFVDKMVIHEEMRHLLGGNMFDLAHEPWLPHRRALQPVFTKRSVRAFGGDMFRAADTVAASWPDGGEIDLDAECRRLTLRALGRSVLGLDLDEHADALAEPVRVALTYIADRALRPARAPRWLPTPARRRARAAAAALHRLAADILQACRADPTIEAPLVHALIAASDPETGPGLSDDEICNELIAFLVAGHDTTATTLGYALWSLGHHRELQQRVAAEVAGLGDRDLTPDDVPRLAYTVAVLHESLRLCPPGAAVGRTAIQDIAVDGYRIPRGTTLIAGVYAIHRDPQLWGNPLTFDPDRFAAPNSRTRDRWQYLPFGAGPRSCIGDHFAMLEATLALATIIRRVEILSLRKDFPLAVPFTTVAAEAVPARVLRRRTLCSPQVKRC